MRVRLVERLGILLVGGFHHVAKKQRVDAIVGISAGFVEGDNDQRSLTELWWKSVIQKLLHPGAGYLRAGVVAVMVQIGSVEGISNQTFFCVLHEEIVRFAGVAANAALAPFLLHLAKAEQWHVAPGVIASFVGNMLGGIIPWTSLVGEFFRILLEVEAGGDQAVSDGMVRGIVGEVHLVVRQKTSAAMDAEIGSRHHGQIIWIGGMKQGMKVSEARALCS